MKPLQIRGLTIDWSRVDEHSYLRKIETLRRIEELEFHKPVTFLAGENGSGKSTLLEAVAVAYGFNPEGGTKNYRFSTYNSHSELHEALTLIRGAVRSETGYFLRAESFYNVATKEEEYSRGPGGRPMHLHEKSHGESFLAMLQSQLGKNGVYLLDEPEAALSPRRQLTLLVEISRCVKDGSQFIIATHSPVLLAYPDAEILSFDHGSIHACTYEETDSYKITSMMINQRKQILHHLLDEE
ncbi:MAG: AAA family ATPase [Solobacterium sp.]|nr:AAA family ATPase [Solobacterium sp.]